MSAAACTGVRPERDAELRVQGWTRQFFSDEPRLGDAVAEYEDMGLEVHLEPFDAGAEVEGGCTACFEDPAVAARFKLIYTRPRSGEGAD